MRAMILMVAAGLTVSGCASGGFGNQGYDWNRPDPRYGNYDPGRYYRPDRRERRLAAATAKEGVYSLRPRA